MSEKSYPSVGRSPTDMQARRAHHCGMPATRRRHRTALLVLAGIIAGLGNLAAAFVLAAQ